MRNTLAAAEQLGLANALPIVIMIADEQGVVTFFNRYWHDYTGQPPFVRDISEGWRAAIHPDDVEMVAQRWHDGIRRGIPVELKYRLREAKTGRFQVFAARAFPLRDDSGKIRQWLGTAMNVNDIDSSDEVRDVFALQGRVVNTFKLTGDAMPKRDAQETLARITVTIPQSLARRVNAFRDAFDISVSSIVEHAVAAYLERGHAEELIADLRQRGASRRRK